MAFLLGDAESEQSRNDLLAIDALRKDSFQELKEQGNALIKQKNPREALDCYTRAILLKVDDAIGNSVLYSNRAHANLLLGNNRHALNDAKDAVGFSASNIKAYYRGVKAALALDLHDEALSLCAAALERDPSNSELTTLQNEVQTKLKQKQERASREKSKERLAKALEQRQVKLGAPLYTELCGGKEPWLDSSNVLHWPVVFLYGEVMTSDLVEDFSEFDRFITHLRTMFGEFSLPWDSKGEYKLDRIELYYLAIVVAPDSDTDAYDKSFDGAGKSWPVKIDNNSTLKSVLAKPDCAVPGVPVFYVVAAGTEFRERFLSGAWSPP